LRGPFVLSPGNKPSLCFVAHFAYGALTGCRERHVGGVERQTSLMAKWFAARQYPVTMITWDEGQRDGEEVDGVRVIKVCRKDAGLPGLRFFYPRWTSLIAALKRADAEIYYQNCSEYVTGQVALWCRRNDRRFVYSVASDVDVDPSLPHMKKLRERFLYRYGLKSADRVIVQTDYQRRRLNAEWGLNAVTIPMPCAITDRVTTAAAGAAGTANRVLWIGRIGPEKRPDWLVRIAERCPDLLFDVVGSANRRSAYARRVERQLSALGNVRLHGFVPYADMPEYYKSARVLCCTSAYEGFPNTFLEAWHFGVPVVSTFDPDGLIASGGLGIAVTDVDGLVEAIRRLVTSDSERKEISARCVRYCRQRHAVEVVMPKFERLFLGLVDGE